MKGFYLLMIGLVLLALNMEMTAQDAPANTCGYDKASMQVLMRFEIKVLPEGVSLLKQSFDACREAVLAREPGCLDYSMFQSYTDSTVFCITETWATKADHDAHMQLEHTKKHLAETRDIRDSSFRPKGNYVYWVCPGPNEVN